MIREGFIDRDGIVLKRMLRKRLDSIWKKRLSLRSKILGIVVSVAIDRQIIS